MKPVDVVRIVWRRRLVAVLGAALVVVFAAVFVSRQPAVYESEASLAFLPDPDNAQTLPFYLGAVEGLLPTYAQYITSITFLEQVAATLPFPTSGVALQGQVQAIPSTGSGVMRIVADAGSATEAQAIAAAVSTQAVGALSANGLFGVELIDEARLPDGPIAPRPRVVLAVAVVLGLFVGVALALAWDRLFGRIEEPQDLTDVPGMRVVGVIPEERGKAVPEAILLGNPEYARLEESLRTLATNVVFALNEGGGPLLVVGMTGSVGASLLAAHLAVVAGELGVTVLVVDADVRGGVQHQIFNLPKDVGLTSVLLRNADPRTVVQPTAFPNVRVVTAGPPLQTRAQELALYVDVVPRFAGMAQLVVIDGPSLRSSDSVRLLAASAGRALVVVRAGTTRPRQLVAAVDALAAVDADTLGIVLGRAREAIDVDALTLRSLWRGR